MALGLDPARFWDLTPRLYDTEMKGAARRLEVERSHVWWTAMMPHVKTPPSLEKFVGGKLRQTQQTPEQLQAMCDALAAAWGAKRVMPDGS